MNDALALGQAAESLVGTPFKVRGRDPRTGVDCIGMLCAALEIIGRDPPVLPTYAMRNIDRARFEPLLVQLGLEPTQGSLQPGDIVLLHPSAAQYHIAIIGSSGRIIHAHASLGCVVASPPVVLWPIEARWKLGDF